MDLGKDIKQSFNLYLQNFKLLLPASLIAGLISVVTLGVLAGPMVGGVLVLALKLLRGEEGRLNEVFSHFDQFVPTFLVTLLLWGATLISRIIGNIPTIGWLVNLATGPVLGLLYFLSIGFIIDQKMRPREAVKRSVDCLAADPLRLWFYSLVMMLIAGIGSFIFFIGLVLTMPLGMVGMTLAYQQLSSKEVPIFKPEKKILQIAGGTLAALLVIGLVCQGLGFGRFASRNRGVGLTGKILSAITGQKVKIDSRGSEITNIKIGNLSFGSGLPEKFPQDIPIYPQAEVGGFLSGSDDEISGSTTTLTSDSSAAEVFDYYVTALKKEGWSVTTSDLDEIKMVNFEKTGRAGVVTINASGDGCDILIGISTE